MLEGEGEKGELLALKDGPSVRRKHLSCAGRKRRKTSFMTARKKKRLSLTFQQKEETSVRKRNRPHSLIRKKEKKRCTVPSPSCAKKTPRGGKESLEEWTLPPPRRREVGRHPSYP